MSYKAVIFDMDGVLIDSEPVYKEINTALFKSLGCNVDDELYKTFIGLGVFKMWHILKTKFDLPDLLEHYVKNDEEFKYKNFKTKEISPMHNIVDLLTFLINNNVKIAVASSSQKRNIELLLSKVDLLKYFRIICAGDEVENGKPSPDIFLKAADKLLVPPEQCIVFEDSTNGVTAAKAANMFCFGVHNPNSGNQDLSKADFIINNYDEKLFVKLHELL